MACKEFVSNDVLTIVWRIDNCSYITKWNHDCVMSSDFKSQTLHGTSLALFLTLSETLDKRGYLCLSLHDTDPEDTYSHFFDCECAFLDAYETPIFTEMVRKCNLSRTANLVLPSGPTVEEVFTTKRSEYLLLDTLTIRLRLWMPDKKMGNDDEYCFIRTVIGVDRAYNLWEIEGFSSLEVNEVLSKSVCFSNYGSCTLKFSLVGSSLESASLNLELTPNFQDPFISCQLSVFDAEMKIFKTMEQYSSVNSDPINFLKSFTRRDILNKGIQFLIEDSFSLLLECELFFYRDVETIYYRPTALKKYIPNTASSLTMLDKADQQRKNDSIIVWSEDFLSLYRNKAFCDFELRCGDADFPVHKLILSARSPVFEVMFSSHVLESDSNFMDVPDLDNATLNRMLTFLYGGTLEPDLDAEDAAKLYYAAAKYQVQSLKERCSFITKSRISKSNVCDILLLADKHRFDKLKSFALDFLFAHLGETISSPEWKEFQDKHLQLAATTMNLLLSRIANDTSSQNQLNSQ